MKPARADHDPVANCLNCGAAVTANYCCICGQETRLHVPSASEFLHEFVGHYVALEGKLWKSLGLLLFRPGRLTAEYIAGRRLRYVAPLRLYLTLSILFFALLKYGNFQLADFSAPDKAQQQALRVDSAARAKLERAHKDIAAARTNPGQADAVFDPHLTSLNPAWAPKLEAFNALAGEKKAKLLVDGFFSYGPYAMFCLLPLFALYLKLLYLGSGRRYGEHLLFALHTNAFAYVQIGLIMLAPWNVLMFALFLWLAFYLPAAMRCVYGGGRWATAVRWVLLMAVHLLSIALAIIGALFFTVIH